MLRSVAPVHRVPWIASLWLGELPKQLPGQLNRISGLLEAGR